jgi:hypothetical protein
MPFRLSLGWPQPGDPIAYAFSQLPNASEFAFLADLCDIKPPNDSFPARAQKFMSIVPLLHAAFAGTVTVHGASD